MQTLALILSIIASTLVIVYLLILIFGRRKEPEVTLTIKGQIVTRTVTVSEPVDVTGRTIEHQ
jgi:hypothetical protein